MAWDYLTTPLAAKPNEAAPWLDIAKMLRQQGHYALADRAYVSAFSTETTNAQILWDRAQLMLETGKAKEAKVLMKQIAEGDWPPQFDSIQTRARQYIDAS